MRFLFIYSKHSIFSSKYLYILKLLWRPNNAKLYTERGSTGRMKLLLEAWRGALKADKRREEKHPWQEPGDYASVCFSAEAQRQVARAAWRMELLMDSIDVGRTSANHQKSWCKTTQGFCF